MPKKRKPRIGDRLPEGPTRFLDMPIGVAFRGVKNSLVCPINGPWMLLSWRIGSDEGARYYAHAIEGDPTKVGKWSRHRDEYYFKATELIVGERIWPARAVAQDAKEEVSDPLRPTLPFKG